MRKERVCVSERVAPTFTWEDPVIRRMRAATSLAPLLSAESKIYKIKLTKIGNILRLSHLAIFPL